MNSILLPQDKANPVIYGALIALAVLLIAGWFPIFRMQPRDMALGAAALIGLLKEIIDWLMNWRARRNGQAETHGVEGLDFVATAAGGVLVWVAAA